PASAALAVEYLGIPAAFALNALSYLIFVGALVLIGPRPQELAERPAGGQVRASIDLLRRRPQLVIFLVIVAAVGFASDPVNTLAPAWANVFGEKDTFGGYIVGVFGARRGDRGVRRRRPGRREQAGHVRDRSEERRGGKGG